MVQVDVIGSSFDSLSEEDVFEKIDQWSLDSRGRYICLSNVHAAVTAVLDENFRLALADSDLLLPDGAPIAWLMSFYLKRVQKRIAGPDLMWNYLSHAAQHGGANIFLYGSTEKVIQLLRENINKTFPEITIVGSYSPPYREHACIESSDVINMINKSNARLVWVALGCPKQECWMAMHKTHIQALMIGVGAAFDFHAGVIKRAPFWMRKAGLEWLHRLLSEPKRLWRRYLHSNLLFVFYVCRQLIKNVVAK